MIQREAILRDQFDPLHAQQLQRGSQHGSEGKSGGRYGFRIASIRLPPSKLPSAGCCRAGVSGDRNGSRSGMVLDTRQHRNRQSNISPYRPKLISSP
jgi:hypothetical protein